MNKPMTRRVKYIKKENTIKTESKIKKEKKLKTPAQVDKEKLMSLAPSTSWSDRRPSKARKTLQAAASSSGDKSAFFLILLRSLLYCTVLY